MQGLERVQQRTGQPARFAAVAAGQHHPVERGVRRRPLLPAPQPFPDVTAEVHAADRNHRPRVRRPPGHLIGIAVTEQWNPQLLVAELVEVALELVGGREREQAPGVGAQHAGRAQVRAERGRMISGRQLGSAPVNGHR